MRQWSFWICSSSFDHRLVLFDVQINTRELDLLKKAISSKLRHVGSFHGLDKDALLNAFDAQVDAVVIFVVIDRIDRFCRTHHA